MNDHEHESTAAPSGGELAEYAVSAATGLGILILALAPLAIPFLVLTAVFVLPLLLIPLVLGLIGAIVASPVLLVRRLGRRLRHQVAATGGRPTSVATGFALRSEVGRPGRR